MATGIKHGNLHGNIHSSIRVFLVEVLKKYLSRTCHIENLIQAKMWPQWKTMEKMTWTLRSEKKHPVLLEETPPARAPPPTTSATPEGFWRKNGEANSSVMGYITTGWWFQPIWKICSSKWKSSPTFGVNIKKHLKPPPRQICTIQSNLEGGWSRFVWE